MIQLINLFKFQFIVLWVVVSGKIEIVVDGEIEKCVDIGTFDISELEFILFNDTYTILNGSLTILNDVKSPWSAVGSFERFQNGKWQQSFLNRKIPDFCSVMYNPIEPWYTVTKNFKQLKCPIAAGTKLIFVNQQLNEFNLGFTSNFVGKWRATLRNEVSTGLLKPTIPDCTRIFFDIVEV